VLPAQIVEQLIAGNGQLADTALQEIAGEGSFRSDQQLGWLGPSPHLAEEGAEAAEILPIRPFLGPHLGNGEAEHV